MEIDSKETGFFWHTHHDLLVKWCYGYTERAKYIRKEKARKEQRLRLRLFKPVKGSLPQEVVEARQAYDQACQAYNRAQQAYNRAYQVREQALQAYDQALIDNMPEIENLHKAECPNCPWDGNTIFP